MRDKASLTCNVICHVFGTLAAYDVYTLMIPRDKRAEVARLLSIGEKNRTRSRGRTGSKMRKDQVNLSASPIPATHCWGRSRTPCTLDNFQQKSKTNTVSRTCFCDSKSRWTRARLPCRLESCLVSVRPYLESRVTDTKCFRHKMFATNFENDEELRYGSG